MFGGAFGVAFEHIENMLSVCLCSFVYVRWLVGCDALRYVAWLLMRGALTIFKMGLIRFSIINLQKKVDCVAVPIREFISK